MATFSGNVLSGSTNGKPIKVTGTTTGASVTVHTAGAGTSGFDEVFIFASNTSGSAATLTLEFGGTTDPDNLIVKAVSIPANSPPIPIVTGQRLNNSLVVKAFAGTADVLNLTGWYNRVA